jgi:hypothetical protein
MRPADSGGDERPEITLVSPDGEHEETTSDPTSAVSLIYGHGYKVKDGATAEEALSTVTPDDAVSTPTE